ncbi:hypothetical protein RHMOL_Rhmol06G0188300 [Rhododendron molle]|uniref:Uncharacterized protein n=1 Tax=Rhododendron molle TaxID=49168 RepID=A0ACC0NF25_RHOML|nr:hypothetical protein RHMOL_Rhmol06G0188300 [Rhododendron molle]
MNDLFKKIQEVSKVSPIEICAEKDNEEFTEPSPSQILLLDPNISICMGRKKDVKGKAASTQSKRLKSGIEICSYLLILFFLIINFIQKALKRTRKAQIVTKRTAQIAPNDLVGIFWLVGFVL